MPMIMVKDMEPRGNKEKLIEFYGVVCYNKT